MTAIGFKFQEDKMTEGVTVFSQQGSEAFVPCIPGKTSDGFHSIEELYQHRYSLFVALIKAYPDRAWRSRRHSDGTDWDGWFIAGLSLPIVLCEQSDITYHLPNDFWPLLDGIPTLDRAPAWDGHTSVDVIARLKSFAQKTSLSTNYRTGKEPEDADASLVNKNIRTVMDALSIALAVLTECSQRPCQSEVAQAGIQEIRAKLAKIGLGFETTEENCIEPD